MNKKYNGGLDLTKLNHSRFKTRIGTECLLLPLDQLKVDDKGRIWLYIDVWINEQKDNYGNDGSVSIAQTKEQREAKDKKVYLGNIKGFDAKPVTKNEPEDLNTSSPDDDLSNLPF